MTREELDKILKNHKHWLRRDCDKWEKLKADLQNADLRDADLQDAILRDINLKSVDLRNANLQGADLRYVDLRGAILQGADLRYTNLQGANLQYANLRGAYLQYADLQSADLRSVNLQGSDLKGVNLQDANLKYAILQSAKNVPFIPMVCPEKGSFIGFKKAGDYMVCIVELEILADAKRSSATSRKCRCDKAKVLSITKLNGDATDITKIVSTSNKRFFYKVGEIVSVDDFDDDRWNECSTGIHFFINRQEAVDY